MKRIQPGPAEDRYRMRRLTDDEMTELTRLARDGRTGPGRAIDALWELIVQDAHGITLVEAAERGFHVQDYAGPHAEGLVGSHRATLRPRATVSHRHTDNTELDERKNVDDRRASKRFNVALWPSPGRERHDRRVPLFHEATDPSTPPMTPLEDILGDDGLLLAVCEQRCKSMNGASARRLAVALEDLARGRIDQFDEAWIRESVDQAEGRRRFWANLVEAIERDDVTVVPCWSPDYPTNLSMIHDRPPVLFVRGAILEDDRRAVAVVGTRTATRRGIEMAGDLSGELAARGVTVVSGLAKGIDTAAHAAAVNASGRTIAVYGTPIDRVYPAANRGLARTITRHGACVSQFLPTTATGPWSFPVRNVTTSGLAVGTIVVEAGETSGAKLQAEAAIAHGKRVFLVDELVTAQPWARAMATTEPTVTVAANVEEIIAGIDAELGVGDLVLL